MITIISGTNRLNSNTMRAAKMAERDLNKAGVKTQMLDLTQLPAEVFHPPSYGNAPKSFEPFQRMITETDGILTVVPEYNGSFPGILKYFIDMLKFPESLNAMPTAFIGVSAGLFGALRSIEQLEMIFHYRGAFVFNKYILLPKVHEKLSAENEITDKFTKDLYDQFLQNFPRFCEAMKVNRK